MTGSVLGENVDIPIVLGESLLSNAPSPFWTVRYHFKPASVAKSGEGLLEVDRESQTASVHLPTSADPSSMLCMSGKYELSRDSLDCVAIFDGQCLRLERAGATILNLKRDPMAHRGLGLPRAGSGPLPAMTGTLPNAAPLVPSVSADSARPPAAGKRVREEPEVGMRGFKQHRLASPLKPPAEELRQAVPAGQVLRAPSPAAGEAWEEEIDLESELLAQLSESRRNSLLLPPSMPDSMPHLSSRLGGASREVRVVKETIEVKKPNNTDPCGRPGGASREVRVVRETMEVKKPSNTDPCGRPGGAPDPPAAPPKAIPRPEAVAQVEVTLPPAASVPSPPVRPPKAAPQPALEDMSELDREFFGGAESSLWSDGEDACEEI